MCQFTDLFSVLALTNKTYQLTQREGGMTHWKLFEEEEEDWSKQKGSTWKCLIC